MPNGVNWNYGHPSITFPNNLNHEVIQHNSLNVNLSFYRPNSWVIVGFLDLQGIPVDVRPIVRTDGDGKANFTFPVDIAIGDYSFVAYQPGQGPSPEFKAVDNMSVVTQIYTKVTQHRIVLYFWRTPWTTDQRVKDFADACTSTIRTVLSPFPQFVVRNPSVSSASVTLNIEERGSPGLPAILLGIFLAAAAIALVILYGMSIYSDIIRTDSKLADDSIVSQITNNPQLTTDQKVSLIKQIFPNGLPNNSDKSTTGADAFGLGGLGSISQAIPLIVGLTLLGAVVGLVPRRRD